MSKWEMVRLGDLGDFQTGGTPSRSNSDYFQGTIPWITTTALGSLYVCENHASEFITDIAIKESSTKIVPPNSLLIGTRVGVGKVSINTVPLCTSQDVLAITGIDQQRVFLPYLYNFLKTKHRYFDAQKRGATIQGIKSETVKEIDVPLPPFYVQQKIADILDHANALIEKRKAQIAKLDLLIKSQFVEMFGNDLADDAIELKNVCSIITDGTHQSPKFTNTGIPFLFVSNIVDNEINYDTKRFISQEEYDALIKRTPVEIDDVLLTIVGSYGNPAVVKSERDFCFQRHIAYMKPKRDIVNSTYLHSAFLSSAVKAQIEVRVKGIAQKTLNLAELKMVKINLPSIELQNRFADFAQRTNASKAEMQQGLNKLEFLYKSFMQKCFLGEGLK